MSGNVRKEVISGYSCQYLKAVPAANPDGVKGVLTYYAAVQPRYGYCVVLHDGSRRGKENV